MQWLIKGGKPLQGEVEVSGAKNSVLPILCASILAETPTEILDVPVLSDVKNLIDIIRSFGIQVQWDKKKKSVVIDNSNLTNIEADHNLVKKLRASFILCGALLGKFGKVSFPFPGGCDIGQRPIDLHLKAFCALGAKYKIEHGYIHIEGKLKCGTVFLDFPSVGATQNAILMAVSLKGKTVILNAAEEPEILDMVSFLNAMGADIVKDSSRRWVINGGKPLKGVQHRIIPDRIEAGTWLLLSAMTGNNIIVKGAEESHLQNLTGKLKESGFIIESNPLKIIPEKVETLTFHTGPYPSFSTDFQPQCLVLATTIPGMHIIVETIFENRYKHVPELRRMGADIKIFDRIAVIYGGKKLTGAKVKATDLRAGMALVMAGLVAEGETIIEDIYHIERGYENLIPKLQRLGADITIIK